MLLLVLTALAQETNPDSAPADPGKVDPSAADPSAVPPTSSEPSDADAAVPADCPELDPLLNDATDNLVYGNLPVAQIALSTAEQSFACRVPSPEQQARYWLLVGAAAWMNNDQDSLRDAFVAARRVAPDYFEDRLGPELRNIYDLAAPVGVAQLSVNPPELRALVDGQPIPEWPLSMEAGYHLVQVLDSAEQVRYGRTLRAPPDMEVTVETGLPADLEPLSVQPEKRRHSAWWLVGAGALAAASGGSYYLSTIQDEQIEGDKSLKELNTTRFVERATTYGTYGLGVASVTSFSLFFIVPL